MGLSDKELESIFEETKANIVILQLQKMGVYYTKLLPVIIRDWNKRLSDERIKGAKEFWDEWNKYGLTKEIKRKWNFVNEGGSS